MIFAQMKDNVIVNTIILDNADNTTLFMVNPINQETYDNIVRIDMIYPQPGIGWVFNNIIFTPPQTVSEE